MNLKKIEVYGFKSFADKSEIVFDSNVTAVVGPNGCGKSNVVDTVRWVLGEQNAKIMRGKTMQDLIFGGTEKRKSMSYCEASLFFDNTGRIFPLDFDEVVISRKLYRSGESEYLLNKNTARLKDISELLREAGLGREGYSIVGQGRMDAVLNAKPFDRRGIFEEALGISNFRVKKAETERKLERNRDNMIRLFDITSELERQLGPLKKQAEDARKYLELSDKIKHHEINLYIYNYDNAATFKEESLNRIKELDDELAHVGKKFSEAFDKMESASAARSELDLEINELHSEETTLSVDIAKQSGEAKLNLEKIGNLRSINDRLTRDIEELNSQLLNAGKKIETLKQSKIEKQSEYENETKIYAGLNEEYSKINSEISANQEINEKAQSEINRILESMNECNSLEASLKSESLLLSKRKEQIETEIAEKAKKIAALISEEKTQAAELKSLSSSKDFLSAEQKDITASLISCENKITDVSSAFNALKQKAAAGSAKLGLLNEHIENLEGFSGGVKQLLQQGRADSKISKLISGAAASVLKVPAAIEPAVTALLGANLDAVITENRAAASELISLLKQKDLGKAAFLPKADLVKFAQTDKKLLTEKGVAGTVLQMISCDAAFVPVFETLLGNAVIVDSLETAFVLSGKYSGVAFATAGGDILLPTGVIYGGSGKANTTNVLGIKREAETAEANLKALEKSILEQESALNKLLSEKIEIVAIEAANRKKLTAAEVAVSAQNEKLKSTARLLENEKAGDIALTKEIETSNARVKEISKNLEQTAERLLEFEARKTTARADAAKRKEEYEILKVRHDKLQAEVTNARIKLSTLKMNIENDEKDIVFYKNTVSRAELEISSHSAEILGNREKMAEVETELQRTVPDEDIYDKLEKVKRSLHNAEQRRLKIKDEYDYYNSEQHKYATEESNLKQKKFREEVNLENTQANIETLRETIWNEYQVTYSNALDFKDENYDPTNSPKEISRLRSERNRMGVVNVLAVESYDETFKRYSEFKTQMDDLKQAESDLNTIIKDLTKEMVIRFNEGFEKINQNFATVFKELFGGGHARLVIEKDTEKQELEWGIEIEAQPPGKRLQNISLLSGGERTMTAISILFAILKLRPMPFCMLDEIEAALDEANCERIARYVRKFSLDTQFVLITHKKPTMEMADVLYGVTMEEKGVSKVVSVKLTEAIKHIMTA